MKWAQPTIYWFSHIFFFFFQGNLDPSYVTSWGFMGICNPFFPYNWRAVECPWQQINLLCVLLYVWFPGLSVCCCCTSQCIVAAPVSGMVRFLCANPIVKAVLMLGFIYIPVAKLGADSESHDLATRVHMVIHSSGFNVLFCEAHFDPFSQFNFCQEHFYG